MGRAHVCLSVPETTDLQLEKYGILVYRLTDKFHFEPCWPNITTTLHDIKSELHQFSQNNRAASFLRRQQSLRQWRNSVHFMETKDSLQHRKTTDDDDDDNNKNNYRKYRSH